MTEARSFGWEPIRDLLADGSVRELILEQWEELAANKDVPLDPDFDRIAALEAAGHYRIWTAREADWLVGFIEFTLTKPLHHRGVLYAFDGGHYLHPERRSPFLWTTMWRRAMPALAALGVQRVMAHDNPKRPLNAAFRRLGFTEAGSLYITNLKGDG